MNTIGVIGSVKGSWEPRQTNQRKKEDEETVITTCSAKTVKWSNVSQKKKRQRVVPMSKVCIVLLRLL
jgi:hypothetical protein